MRRLTDDETWVIGGEQIYRWPFLWRRGVRSPRWRSTCAREDERRRCAGARRVVGRHRGGLDDQQLGLRYRFHSYITGMSRLTAGAGARIAVAAQGFHEPEAARRREPRASAAADLADPGAAAGFGVGGGARALCAGVQPARPLRPRCGGSRGVESQRAVAEAARRVLGARGRADGGRRLAAAALADAGVHRRPVGQGDRQEEREAGRRRRRRSRRARAVDGGPDRGAPRIRAAWKEGSVVGPQRHQVGRRGAVVALGC